MCHTLFWAPATPRGSRFYKNPALVKLIFKLFTNYIHCHLTTTLFHYPHSIYGPAVVRRICVAHLESLGQIEPGWLTPVLELLISGPGRLLAWGSMLGLIFTILKFLIIFWTNFWIIHFHFALGRSWSFQEGKSASLPRPCLCQDVFHFPFFKLKLIYEEGLQSIKHFRKISYY